MLRDIEQGRYATFLRLFAAGLACGLVWETFNYFAPQKWIYTVRGLDEVKLFEMPLLGFLGFPALAFDAVAVHSLISWTFQGNAGWGHSPTAATRSPPAARLRPGPWRPCSRSTSSSGGP